MASKTNERGTAAWFLTEQAECLAQAGRLDTDDFRACRDALEYLTRGDAETMDAFKMRTEAVEPNPDADYDAEDYYGKDRDLASALYTLLTRASDRETPEQARTALTKGAGIIAAFYGADLDLTA
jgi:hypothetical protein